MSSGQLVGTKGSNPMALQLFEGRSDSANFSDGLAMACSTQTGIPVVRVLRCTIIRFLCQPISRLLSGVPTGIRTPVTSVKAMQIDPGLFKAILNISANIGFMTSTV